MGMLFRGPTIIARAVSGWIAPRRSAAKYGADLADAEILNNRLSLENARLHRQNAELDIALRKSEAEISVMKVSLDGMAVVVKQYEQYVASLIRIHAMKGQPPSNDNDLS